jgi:NPCBM/NEW2 domain-containing protein
VSSSGAGRRIFEGVLVAVIGGLVLYIAEGPRDRLLGRDTKATDQASPSNGQPLETTLSPATAPPTTTTTTTASAPRPPTTTTTSAPRAVAAPAPSTVWLDELAAVDHGGSTTNGIYPKTKGSTGGTEYTHVLVGSAGCQSVAYAWVEYDLSKDWARFSTVVGISDNSSSKSQASFTVSVDGRQVADGSLRPGATVPVDVSVAGGLRLRLEITDPNAPSQACGFESIKTWVVFGNPKLTV